MCALDKSIISGKEHRKPYRGAKAIDAHCRNNIRLCDWCVSNRLRFDTKHRTISDEKLKEWRKEWQD